jgi:hypothetical protein
MQDNDKDVGFRRQVQGCRWCDVRWRGLIWGASDIGYALRRRMEARGK